MTAFRYLTRRNTKLFFRDRGTFLGAMIAPLILLLLFITFLGNVYRDSFSSALPAGAQVPDSIVEGFVGGYLFSSLLAVCCVTVAFSANMILVQDKVTGALGDLTIAPVRSSTLGLSYYSATALATGLICLLALAAGLVYLSLAGWYLTLTDILLVLLDIALLVLFGTALSSLVCFFLRSEGGITAVSAIVSAAYGFLCGAYMPINSFSGSIQKFISLLPGTYGTGLLHRHLMSGPLAALEQQGLPAALIEGLRDGFDNNLYFFGSKVSQGQMYLALSAAVVVLVGLYVGLNLLRSKGKK